MWQFFYCCGGGIVVKQRIVSSITASNITLSWVIEISTTKDLKCSNLRDFPLL